MLCPLLSLSSPVCQHQTLIEQVYKKLEPLKRSSLEVCPKYGYRRSESPYFCGFLRVDSETEVDAAVQFELHDHQYKIGRGGLGRLQLRERWGRHTRKKNCYLYPGTRDST